MARPLASLIVGSWAMMGAVLAFACSGSGESKVEGGSEFSGGSGGNAGVGAGGSGGTSQTSGGSSGAGQEDQCVSGILCGSGDCCEVGEECVLGACQAACESQVRCSADLSVCCGSDQVCLASECVDPGAPCDEWADCEENEFCEPTVGKCLPQPAEGASCIYKPPVEPLNPAVEWSWTSSSIHSDFVQVINMPVVIDLEKDGTPDVVIVTSDGYSATGPAYLRALDGKTGVEKWPETADVYKEEYRVSPRGTPAAGDIDGDGEIEIVSLKMGGGLIAFGYDGRFKWVSKEAGEPWNGAFDSATVALADLEGDGSVEVIAAGAVFNGSGELKFNAGLMFGSNNNEYGTSSIVADVDGDGVQEILSGRRAIKADGTELWNNGLADGYPAIADLDGDGEPELIAVSNSYIRVHNARTGVQLASVKMPGEGRGGPPTVADFDKDGQMEIAAANGTAYSVYEYVGPVGEEPASLSVKWQVTTQDGSSNRTGSSVFDFQGDGAAEVVYNDECYFRVYSGETGDEVYKVQNSSATIHEYPVVVDVDGDNKTEVVIAANNVNHMNSVVNCPYPKEESRAGVFVLGDSNDNWVRTRKVWNQHAYHITNISVTGEVASPEPPSWVSPPGFNNYRQSNQGEGVFNAPDLQVSLGVDQKSCPAALTLRATVTNQGSLGIPAGIPVMFYSGSVPDMTNFLGTAQTQGPLLPGQFEEIAIAVSAAKLSEADQIFSVFVDADVNGNSTVNECLEANNSAVVENAGCPVVR